MTDRRTELPDLWQVDLTRGTWTRLTFGPKSNNTGMASPDGKFLYFSSNRAGAAWASSAARSTDRAETSRSSRRPSTTTATSSRRTERGSSTKPRAATGRAASSGGCRSAASASRRFFSACRRRRSPTPPVARRKVLRVLLRRDGPRGGVRAEVPAVGREVADLDGRRRPGALARGRAGAVFPLDRPQAHGGRRCRSRATCRSGVPKALFPVRVPAERDLRQPLAVHPGSGRQAGSSCSRPPTTGRTSPPSPS